MSAFTFSSDHVVVNHRDVHYSEKLIDTRYEYRTSFVQGNTVTPSSIIFDIRTQRHVPRVGLMLVGWGGNNGSTITAGILANRERIRWETKEGMHDANYYGSMTQCSTVHIGFDSQGKSVNIPFSHLFPFINPNELILGGWDISSMNIADSMHRAAVIDIDLQRKVTPLMQDMRPLPSIFNGNFVAANQAERADNVLTGSMSQQVNKIRRDISNFKQLHGLDKVIVLWTATTERFSEIIPGTHDTAANLLSAVFSDKYSPSCEEISPSSLFALASLLEGCCFINGSPQNTLVPAIIDLSLRLRTEKNYDWLREYGVNLTSEMCENVFVAGDDFKTGQTKLKSVLVDFLVSAGIKPLSIVSYNHLGNNDGRNLSAPPQFRSKEISKSNVVDDSVESNQLLYPLVVENGELVQSKPDHVVVIKYVPAVGDTKIAIDDYMSEIFLGGRSTISIHNVCEDSLLAAPVMLDLIVLAEACQRIQIKLHNEVEYSHFHPVLSLLSYLLKAPVVPESAPVVNALFNQRMAIINIFRACIGLPPNDFMQLEHRLVHGQRMFKSGEVEFGQDDL